MEQHVLEIDREVEDDDRGHDPDPGRERDHVEQAKATRLGKKGETDGGGGKENADQQRVHGDDAEIVGPAPAAADRLFSPRHDEFPDRHHDEHAAEGGQPDIGLIGEQDLTHGLSRSEQLDQLNELLLFNHSIE